jgi:hypothetical protein
MSDRSMREPKSCQITEGQANAIYNSRHKVSWIRQLWFGATTISKSHFLKPCPRCHGNDRLREIAEAPGFVLCECQRCDMEYLA